MSDTQRITTSKGHLWSELEESLQVLWADSDPHSLAYEVALCRAMAAATFAASRILNSPRLKGAAREGEDVAQEWWIRMATIGFKRYRPDQGPLSPYCYTILRNMCIAAVRAACRRRTESLEDELVSQLMDPADVTQVNELRVVVRRAIQRLPKEQRLPLKLRYRKCFSAQTIAGICSISDKSVNWQTFEARKALRYSLRHFVT